MFALMFFVYVSAFYVGLGCVVPFYPQDDVLGLNKVKWFKGLTTAVIDMNSARATRATQTATRTWRSSSQQR